MADKLMEEKTFYIRPFQLIRRGKWMEKKIEAKKILEAKKNTIWEETEKKQGKSGELNSVKIWQG